jgi:hypothetical protein
MVVIECINKTNKIMSPLTRQNIKYGVTFQKEIILYTVFLLPLRSKLLERILWGNLNSN